MRDLVFVDIETTGLDPDRHEIIEVAALRVDGATLQVKGLRYHARVLPERPETIDPEATALNGYCPVEWARTAKGAGLVRRELRGVLEGAGLSAHNTAFETLFLARWFPDQPWHHHGVDTQALAMPLLRAGLIEGVASFGGVSVVRRRAERPSPRVAGRLGEPRGRSSTAAALRRRPRGADHGGAVMSRPRTPSCVHFRRRILEMVSLSLLPRGVQFELSSASWPYLGCAITTDAIFIGPGKHLTHETLAGAAAALRERCGFQGGPSQPEEVQP